ncbi:MAG: ATP-binding protein [Bacteroidales bacterium]|nr:ATP-binding protein [Bacteroidales bacterium]
MIKRSVIQEIVVQQQMTLNKRTSGYLRHILSDLDLEITSHALIISGIRRCGKSTLLHQLINSTNKDYLFLNFDIPKFYNFELNHFALLDSIISERKSKILFFDEIQIITGWELYVRQKLDEGYQVVVTGSNASLLSQELGTKLTGRHITKELFPFSFREFCEFKDKIADTNSLTEYLKTGGFPEYIKTENRDILASLIDDIIYRDIAVRHNIRDVQSLKRLITNLATNVGNLVTATKLTKILSIKSPATVMEYFGFFEQSYMVQLMPKFAYSYKVQLVNPRKIYFIDNGLLDIISSSFSKDDGHKLENAVFWELRRRQKDLYYYNENGKECDFVVCENNKVEQLVQVCYDLNIDNSSREIDALLDAMEFFKLENGIIVTLNQSDVILHNGKQIQVIPAYEYFYR